MSNKINLQQKIKVLNKLFDNGYKTEKELQSLSLEKVLAIDNISVTEMTVIIDLQKNVKAGKLFSYLGGDDND